MQKINGDQIDYNYLRFYIPDYSNRENTNYWSGTSTWTSNRVGFVYFWLYSYNVSGTQSPVVRINNVIVNREVSEVPTSQGARVTGNSGILPVDIGDTISYASAGAVNNKELYFIPGKWISTGGGTL